MIPVLTATGPGTMHKSIDPWLILKLDHILVKNLVSLFYITYYSHCSRFYQLHKLPRVAHL